MIERVRLLAFSRWQKDTTADTGTDAGNWERSRIAVLLAWRGEALDDDSGCFEVRYLMVGTVSHEDRLSQKGDKGTGLLWEPPANGLVPINDQVIGHVAFGAEDRCLQPARE